MAHPGARKATESDSAHVDGQPRLSAAAVQRALDIATVLALAVGGVLLSSLVASIVFGPSVTTAL
ncbi:MAG: hypothetical protein KIT36_18740 [Alphaproteobacteria bacterium]|nr:hypothetical protein [Alphaproteobacteria bacterium]